MYMGDMLIELNKKNDLSINEEVEISVSFAETPVIGDIAIAAASRQANAFIGIPFLFIFHILLFFLISFTILLAL